jgi:hypothetical protein
MIGAFIGALIVLTISTVLSWQFSGNTANGGSRTGRSPATRPVVMRASVGDCLNWARADSTDIAKVNCDQGHLLEVTGDADLAANFPAGSPYPAEDQWQKIKQERCAELAGTRLGGKFDPFGRFTVGAFTPSEQGWQDGDRIMRCALQLAGPSGALHPITGRIEGQDQSDVYEPGTCLGIDGKTFSDPIDCGQQHAYEVVGLIDLTKLFKPQDGFPGNKQDATIEVECAKAATDYAGGPTVVQDKKLTVTWDTRRAQSWDAGSTKVNCKVGARLPDSSGLAPVVGGVKGPVTIGTEPAPTGQRRLRPGVPAPKIG